MKVQDVFVAELRARLPEYMAQRGQVVGSRGKKMIRCINPSHNDSTPSMSYYPKNQTLHCFGCGKSYDLFDLIQLDYPDCASFPKQVRRACQLFDHPLPEGLGREENQTPPRAVRPAVKADMQADAIIIPNDYTNFIEEAVARRGIGGGYFTARGIPQPLCEKYKLFEEDGRAYLPVWSQGRCVAYCSRSISEQLEPRYKNSPGVMGIFGADYLLRAEPGGALVITEAIFDALAAEACGFRAVALCGAGNVSRFLKLCEQHAAAANTYIYMLAGDDDQAGHRMNEELAQGLRAQGLSCTVLPPPPGCKDLNEALLTARPELESALSAAENADRAVYEKGSAAAAIDELFATSRRRAKQGGISTGFAELDCLLNGGLYAGLYVLGAVSSLGKTSLLLQMADAIAQAGTDVLFFSLEMSRYELMAKSLSRIQHRLEFGSKGQAMTAREILMAGEGLALGQAMLLEQAVNRYRQSADRLFIREGIAQIGVRELREAVAEHVRLRGYRPVVMVDYLQILKPADPRASDKQNIDRAIVELKRISRDFDLPVFAISSFNRESYRNPVTMEAFKESGAVEYSCDLLFGLQPAGIGEAGFDLNASKLREPREVELVLLKNRSGVPYGKLKYHYYAKYSEFISRSAHLGKTDMKEKSKRGRF